jgi:beta-galactosidase
VSDWNWKGNEGKIMDVNIYSSCGQVELFLNGKSLGKKITDRSTRYLAVWQVPYEQGILKAVGLNGKKQVATADLRSASDPISIKFTADRNRISADGQDLSYITVELTDVEGICNPKADNQVSFEVTGPGTIAGVGNANPVSLESFQGPQRKAWHGRCMVIVKADRTAGKITLKASSPGLEGTSIEIESNQDPNNI